MVAAKKDQVVLAGAAYNFSVSSTRIWLENDETKMQWDWFPTPSDHQQFVPHQVFIDELKGFFTNGSASGAVSASLEPFEKDQLLVRLTVQFTGSTGAHFPAKRSFVLKPLAVSEAQVYAAKLMDCRAEMVELQKLIPQVELLQLQVNALQQQVDLPWCQKLWEFFCRVARGSLDIGKQACRTTKAAAEKLVAVSYEYFMLLLELMFAQPDTQVAHAQSAAYVRKGI